MSDKNKRPSVRVICYVKPSFRKLLNKHAKILHMSTSRYIIDNMMAKKGISQHQFLYLTRRFGHIASLYGDIYLVLEALYEENIHDDELDHHIKLLLDTLTKDYKNCKNDFNHKLNKRKK